MYRIITLFIFTLLGSALVGQNRMIIDKVVAKVGGELILLSEIEQQYTLISQEQGGIPPEFRCNIMEGLLAQKVLLNQAKVDSIEVADEEVEAQLQARIDRILAYMNNDLELFQQQYGKTVNEVKEGFREDLKNNLLVERYRGQILNDVTITPAEVKDFFAEIPKDSLPYFNSEVEVGEIVIFPEVNDEESGKAKDQLAEVRRRIVEDGEDFAELARIYSDDPGSGRAGGDLGMQKRGTFVPEFEAAAYNLEKDEISPVIESEFGFHIIQLIERRGNAIHVRHILIKPEITYTDLDKTEARLDTIRNLVVTDSIAFIVGVKRYSDDSQPSFNNGGDLVNPQTGNSFFEIGDLDPDVFFTIDTMQVGDVSSPFMFETPTGERGFRIVKLKSRTAPHKASLDKDYSKIKTAALEQKKARFLNEWLVDQVENVYLSIEEGFQSCENLDLWFKDKGVRP